MSSFRHVIRRLRRSPGFTIVSVLTLAIGIGANSAIFSVLHSILIRPLPFPAPERLVSVWHTAPGLNIRELNSCPGTYFTYKEENQTFEGIGLWRRDSASITGVAEPEQVRMLNVSDAVLPVLGVQPALGRWFSKRDDSPGAPLTVIISHGYWQRRLGSDRSILGRVLQVDGRPREIIGVMPERFRYFDERAEIIVPLQLDRRKAFIGEFSYDAIARLKPVVTITQANADVARMLPIMTQKFAPPPGMKIDLIKEARLGPDVRPLKRDIVGDIGTVLWILMGTVGIVLLIACANVANLLLVRADGRQSEFAIRTALGASRSDIARELLVESLVLGMLGGIGGLVLSYWALKMLVRISPSGLPRVQEIGIDGVSLVFTFFIALLASIFFGLVPVFRYAGPRVAGALRSGGRTMSAGRERHRTRGALVVVQVALALVLLISSGLMIRTVAALRDVRPGFTQPNELLTMRLSIPSAQVPKPEQVTRMYNDIVEKISSIPGVESVAVTSSVTLDGNTSNDPIYAQDRTYAESALPPLRRYKSISPGVFRTLGQPLVAGRDLTWTDVYQVRNVVLVSENMARELWGSPGNALGKRVREKPTGIWREVIGVVGDARDNGLDRPAPTIVYWPMMVDGLWNDGLEARRGLAVAVRSKRTGSAGFLSQVQQAIWSVNPSLPIANVRTVQEIAERSMARTSFALVMLSIAAGTALLLGIIGIYGVISYSISQRTKEIGIRMALGASQGRVRVLFVRHGVLLTAIGIVCGFAAAIPLSRFMASLLYGTGPIDVPTYSAVALLLIGAAIVAAYVPARRATVVEPLEALRVD